MEQNTKIENLLKLVSNIKEEDVKKELTENILDLGKELEVRDKKELNQKAVIGKSLRAIQKNLNSKNLVDKQGLAEAKNKLKVLLKV